MELLKEINLKYISDTIEEIICSYNKKVETQDEVELKKIKEICESSRIWFKRFILTEDSKNIYFPCLNNIVHINLENSECLIIRISEPPFYVTSLVEMIDYLIVCSNQGYMYILKNNAVIKYNLLHPAPIELLKKSQITNASSNYKYVLSGLIDKKIIFILPYPAIQQYIEENILFEDLIEDKILIKFQLDSTYEDYQISPYIHNKLNNDNYSLYNIICIGNSFSVFTPGNNNFSYDIKSIFNNLQHSLSNRITSGVFKFAQSFGFSQSTIDITIFIRTEIIYPIYTFTDKGRTFTNILLSSLTNTIITSDNLGRIMMFDLTNHTMISIYKGYRESQISFYNSTIYTILVPQRQAIIYLDRFNSDNHIQLKLTKNNNKFFGLYNTGVSSSYYYTLSENYTLSFFTLPYPPFTRSLLTGKDNFYISKFKDELKKQNSEKIGEIVNYFSTIQGIFKLFFIFDQSSLTIESDLSTEIYLLLFDRLKNIKEDNSYLFRYIEKCLKLCSIYATLREDNTKRDNPLNFSVIDYSFVEKIGYSRDKVNLPSVKSFVHCFLPTFKNLSDLPNLPEKFTLQQISDQRRKSASFLLYNFLGTIENKWTYFSNQFNFKSDDCFKLYLDFIFLLGKDELVKEIKSISSITEEERNFLTLRIQEMEMLIKNETE